MPYINYENKEIVFKIVYYGPGMSGKTTNLVYIHKSLSDDLKGDLVTLDTEEERTLFFDFFPLELGQRSWTDLGIAHVHDTGADLLRGQSPTHVGWRGRRCFRCRFATTTL